MKIDEIIEHKLRLIFNDESIVFDTSRFAGGLTNYNYIMNIKGVEYVIRKPGGMTNEMIDRNIEKVNNSIASELGINSECVYFDEINGIKISIYVKNSKNLALVDPNSESSLNAVAELMKKIHTNSKSFPNIFDWKIELDKYEQIVKTLNGEFFFDYEALKGKLFEFAQEYITDYHLVPCHNDTVPENFIMDDTCKTYLIDWEYSGMNDPSWDVAAYILESRLNESAINLLLEKYYGRTPDLPNILKIKTMMVAQDLLWVVWALIRHYNGDDFLDYCHLRYERLRRNIKALTENKDYAISEMVNM